MALFYLFDNGVKFSVLGFINNVRHIVSDDRLVGWNLDNVHAVDFAELLLLGHRGTGHTGQLFIHTEQVLIGDGRQCLGFPFDLYALFCFDCLMQTLAVTTSVHDTSGELVDNHNLIVLDNVVDVALHGAVRLDCLVDVVLDGGVFHVHQVFQTEEFLCLFDTGFGQGRSLCLFIDDVVGINNIVVFFLVIQLFYLVHLQGAGKAVRYLVQVGGFVSSAGDNQRGSSLVNQNRVDLVDNGKVMTALYTVFFINLHVVTQIVKTKFVIGTIGNIRIICLLAVCRLDVVDDQTDGQSQPAVDLAHLFRVTLCKVVVDGDNMDALSGQRIQVNRQGGNQCLTFTGLHLSDTTLMQHDTADNLHREVLHAQHPPCSLAAGSKCFRQDVIQRLSVAQTLLELWSHRFQLLVGHFGKLFVQRKDLVANRIDSLELSFRVGPKDFIHQSHNFFYTSFLKGTVPGVTSDVLLEPSSCLGNCSLSFPLSGFLF